MASWEITLKPHAEALGTGVRARLIVELSAVPGSTGGAVGLQNSGPQ